MYVEFFEINAPSQLKTFVENKGLEYVRGNGYYQLTKTEKIADVKHIIVQRIADNMFITGDNVKTLLGLTETKNFNIDASTIPDFKVYVQSTAYNRKLLAGTLFLYVVSAPGYEVKETLGSIVTGAISDSLIVADLPEVVSTTTPSVELPKPIDVAISFDTTGSMYTCLSETRRRIAETVKTLFDTIPDIRFSITAHGDYGDIYVTKNTPFTTNPQTIIDFVNTVPATNGYDSDECYELVLHETRSLNWRPDSKRILIMIGDATPHPYGHSRNQRNIYWRTEATALREMGVSIYSVQALGSSTARNSFWEPLAKSTDGVYLQLDQFSHTVQIISAICYHGYTNQSLTQYRDQIQASGQMNRSMHAMFNSLMGISSSYSAGNHHDRLTTVAPSRFQVLTVDRRCSIKEFVNSHSLIFKTGRGFYEFTKPEVISDKKELVLMDKITGDMYTGEQAATIIGRNGGKIRPSDLAEWRVFVQSTSYNRVLVENTGFLYEVDTSA
jgi:hypothetical protein